MKTVQRLLLTTSMMLLLASASIAADKTEPTAMPAPTTVYQAKSPITLQSGEYELLSMIMEAAPGVGVPRHKHGGQVLVLVLSGELTLRQNGTERVMKTGDSWTENAGDEHSVINTGNVTARVAVSMVLPKGAEATTIIKP